uniref:Uncharacterized protein n=1 Tax=Aegilops tauschii TaxID=37682 RepID=N1QT95_AEGTA
MDFAWNAGWEAAPPACNPDPDQPGAAEVPALMKMNVSSEITAKEAEDNVLPREMHNIQYSYVLHNAPHKVPAPFPAAVRRRERRLLDLEMEVSTTYRTRAPLLSDSSSLSCSALCSG